MKDSDRNKKPGTRESASWMGSWKVGRCRIRNTGTCGTDYISCSLDTLLMDSCSDGLNSACSLDIGSSLMCEDQHIYELLYCTAQGC